MHGYKKVILYKNNKRYHKSIHRLVAIAFIPNKDKERDVVNHIDGVKTNNCVSNLEWVTTSENIKHAYRIGLHKPNKGKRKFNGKDKREGRHILQFDKDNNFINEFVSQNDAARAVNGVGCNIGRCCKGVYQIYKGYKWRYK